MISESPVTFLIKAISSFSIFIHLADNESVETTTEINAIKLHRIKPQSPQGTPRVNKRICHQNIIKNSFAFLASLRLN